MTAYGIQAPPHAGLTLTMTAPSGTAGDTAPTGDHYGLLVNNVGSAAITVVLPFTPTYDGQAIAARSVSVPGTAATGSALGGYVIIPTPSAVYGLSNEAITYSTVTNVTVAALRIP